MIEMQVDVQQILRDGAERTDRALERLLPPVTQIARVDPWSHAAQRICGRQASAARCSPWRPRAPSTPCTVRIQDLPDGIEDLGAAIEMLHTYSLIHDDLPALDNDDLRRGQADLPRGVWRGHRDSGRRRAADSGLSDAGAALRCAAGAGHQDCGAHRRSHRHGGRYDRRPGARPRRRAHKADGGKCASDSSREDRAR